MNQQGNTTPVYYTASGRFSVAGLFIALTVIVHVSALAGITLAYGCLWIHHAALDAFLSLGLALLLGLLLTYLVRLGKIRNGMLVLLLALAPTLSYIYFYWAAWSLLYHGQQLENLSAGNFTNALDASQFMARLGHPFQVWKSVIATRYNISFHIVYGMIPVSGSILYAAWLIEVIAAWCLIVIFPAAQADKVFSDAANEWAKEYVSPTIRYIENGSVMRQALERGDYSVFSQLSLSGLSSHSHSTATLTVHYVSHSYDFYLTIDNTRVNEVNPLTQHVGGGIATAAAKYSHEVIVDKLRIPADIGEMLIRGNEKAQAILDGKDSSHPHS